MSAPRQMLAIAVVFGIAVAGFMGDASAVTVSQMVDTGALIPHEIAIDQATGDIYLHMYEMSDNTWGISKILGNGIIPVYPLSASPMFGGMGLAAGDGYLFFGNPNSGPWTDSQIFRAPESGSGPVIAIYTGAYDPQGQRIFDVFDVACQGGQVYSVDAAYGKVARLNSDGSNLQVLTGPTPTGVYEKGEFIALSNDRIFVADATGGYYQTTPGGVYSVPISGGGWTTLATGEFRHIAFLNDTIYALSADGQSIWQVPASGGSASLLVEGSPFGSLHSIAAYDGMLYVTDTGLNKVWRIFGPESNVDTTAPVIAAGTPTGTEGSDGWWASDVTVPFSATDDLSGFAPDGALSTDLASQTTVGEGSDLYVTSDGISDMAGNAAVGIQARPFSVDKTEPEMTVTLPGTGEYLLGREGLDAAWLAEDTLSGVVPPDTGTIAIDTASVGEGSVIVPAGMAVDFAGNASEAVAAAYHVHYAFNGLLPPYQAPPSAFKINSSVPLRWQYTDVLGNAVDSAVACPVIDISLVNTDTTEGNPIIVNDPGSSGLRYDSDTMTWQFNWQTRGQTAGIYSIQIESGETGQINGPFPIQLK